MNGKARRAFAGRANLYVLDRSVETGCHELSKMILIE